MGRGKHNLKSSISYPAPVPCTGIRISIEQERVIDIAADENEEIPPRYKDKVGKPDMTVKKKNRPSSSVYMPPFSLDTTTTLATTASSESRQSPPTIPKSILKKTSTQDLPLYTSHDRHATFDDSYSSPPPPLLEKEVSRFSWHGEEVQEKSSVVKEMPVPLRYSTINPLKKKHLSHSSAPRATRVFIVAGVLTVLVLAAIVVVILFSFNVIAKPAILEFKKSG